MDKQKYEKFPRDIITTHLYTMLWSIVDYPLDVAVNIIFTTVRNTIYGSYIVAFVLILALYVIKYWLSGKYNPFLQVPW